MSLLKHLSNNVGKSIKAKIIVIESDDWGSIRMPSNKIRESLERKGFDLGKGEERYRYSLYDTLASKDDFEQLFNTLTAFKDSKGKYPVFTAMALVANPDFEGIAKSNFTQYFYEPMLKTLERYGIERTLLKYEQMERLSLLELAVWKCTIQNDPFFSTLQEIRDQWALNEKFDPAAYANERRVTSGITEIIQNVLPFLGKPWEN